jgi:hypothetical protein
LFQQNFDQLENINNISNINIDKNNRNNIIINENIEKQNQNKIQDIINNINIQSNITKNISDNDTNRKLGIAFVYSTLFSNGISRFIIVTSNYFVETGRYDVYLITGKPYHKEYKFNEKIKRFIGYNNLTVIKNISRNYKIDFFILQNVLAISTIKWFKSLGSKIIGMFHGNYMSGMFLYNPFTYKHWNNSIYLMLIYSYVQMIIIFIIV